jgi:hypothetical protein
MIEKLQQLITEMETYIPQSEKINTAVSASSVGWQIEHSLLVINSISNVLQQADPIKYRPSFRLFKHIIFATHKIPRGKAKAPKQVIPQLYTIETLQNHLQKTKINVQTLPTIPPNHFFTHPLFGDLNQPATIKFLYIHTLHHVKIMRDMLK